jgi:LysM repeat protein
VGQSLIIPMSGTAKAPQSAAASVAPSTRTSKAPVTVSSSSYTVRRGDTLSLIAAKFNVTINDLKKWNKLISTRLNVGQKLAIGESKARTAN